LAEFAKICGDGVRSTKKNPAKIGRELINQGASTNLISRPEHLFQDNLAEFGRICGDGVRSTKKNPAKIGRELINQGASTH
jgi:hypothetical protein